MKLRSTHFSVSKKNVMLCETLTSYSALRSANKIYSPYVEPANLRKTKDAAKTKDGHVLSEGLSH